MKLRFSLAIILAGCLVSHIGFATCQQAAGFTMLNDLHVEQLEFVYKNGDIEPQTWRYSHE